MGPGLRRDDNELPTLSAMHLADFDFDLPRELIAPHPCEPRDAARLLFIPRAGGFEDRQIKDLPTLLRPGDLLVLMTPK
jgi:S-adenosylmethionine:tRNA-ribosyltransferase-isomerase (queuine synthetase)